MTVNYRKINNLIDFYFPLFKTFLYYTMIFI